MKITLELDALEQSRLIRALEDKVTDLIDLARKCDGEETKAINEYANRESNAIQNLITKIKAEIEAS